MNVDSRIPTYRGTNGIYTKSIRVDSEIFSNNIGTIRLNPNDPQKGE